jgi:serine/threonine protein kinase
MAGLQQEEQQGNFHSHYVLQTKISQGGFSQVHLACKLEKNKISKKSSSGESSKGSMFTTTKSLSSDRSDKSKQASLADFIPNRSVKIVDLRMKPKNIGKLAQNEVAIWKTLGKHNHIVRLMNVKHEFGMSFLIMEMCSTSLLHYLSSMPVVDERTLGESFAQMLLGIEFLHKSNIVHRDIKPDHFAVGGENACTIKLHDFALATVHDKKLSGECGTALFMAPEMVLHHTYDMKVDIWSFGVIVYALLFGRFPYDVDGKDSDEVKQTIASAEDAPSFRTVVPISPTALAFTMSLLCRNPLERPSATAALEQKFMIDITTQNHEVDDDLPSLNHQLHQVKQLRAFQNRDLHHKSEIDDMLNRQQLFVHGLPLPGMKQQSIVAQKFPSSNETHHASSKRNAFDCSKESETEKFGFALGEKVKCAEVVKGISAGAVGQIIGFTESREGESLVKVDFPGCAKKKLKPTQLLKEVDERGSIRNFEKSPSMDFSKQDSMESVFSKETSLASSLDGTSSLETCDLSSVNLDGVSSVDRSRWRI